MPSPRIGINAAAITPERPGGDVSYVLEMVRRCPRVWPDAEWVIFESAGAQELIGELPSNVRRVRCSLPHRSTIVRALWEQSMLPRIAQQQRLDVLFAPVNVSPIGYHGRVVLTLHEAEPFQPDTRIPKPLLAWWRVTRELSAKRADRMLTVSEAARQDLVRWMGLPEDRIHVVHLGVDVARFSSGGALTDVRDPYVLWVGRPYPRKGLDTLLSAFADLRRAGRPERLVMIGPPGWDEPRLRATIHRNFEPGAVLRLPSVWGELPSWYASAAAFVFPSRQETFGLPVLEAMASGTPVLASDIAALHEVAGEAALYVKPGHAEELSHALSKLLLDARLRDQLRDKGYARAALFDWHVTARKTCEHLRAVIE